MIRSPAKILIQVTWEPKEKSRDPHTSFPLNHYQELRWLRGSVSNGISPKWKSKNRMDKPKGNNPLYVKRWFPAMAPGREEEKICEAYDICVHVVSFFSLRECAKSNPLVARRFNSQDACLSFYFPTMRVLIYDKNYPIWYFSEKNQTLQFGMKKKKHHSFHRTKPWQISGKFLGNGIHHFNTPHKKLLSHLRGGRDHLPKIMASKMIELNNFQTFKVHYLDLVENWN